MMGINQRYRSSKQDALEKFTAYMRKLIKKIIIFILFYLYLYFGPQVYILNSSLRIFGIVP